MAENQSMELTPEEAAHRDSESRVRSFKYRTPTDFRGANKALVQLVKSDIIKGMVQVIREGGENILHYHDRMDTFWMVLKGRAAFYGPGDVLIGEYGPHEGLLMPRGARYWFAKCSDDELELLQVSAFEGPMDRARRIALAAEGQQPSNRNIWLDAQRDNEPL